MPGEFGQREKQLSPVAQIAEILQPPEMLDQQLVLAFHCQVTEPEHPPVVVVLVVVQGKHGAQRISLVTLPLGKPADEQQQVAGQPANNNQLEPSQRHVQ